MKRSESGFTLLEFSIVIVIIGFIIAGILMAQTMIRSAHLQNVLAEYDTYVKAVNEFRDKFVGLPGDITNAESMWGSDTTCPTTAASTTPHVATCNGDGNGAIGASDTSATLSNSYEWHRAWQQMYAANFIQGRFTGTVSSGGAQEVVPGRNGPGSSVSGAGWSLLYYLQTANNANLWGDQYGHIMTLGGLRSGSYTTTPVLSAGEALALDLKVDDGRPGTGYVRAWRTALQPNCSTSDTTQTAQAYNQTNTATQACSLIFLLGF